MTTATTTTSSHLEQLQQLVLAMPMAQTLGLRFIRVAPGEIELEIPVTQPFTFRPGQLQATAVFAVADFAAVSAAGTLLPPGWINATVDATLKLVGPARGKALRARGRVVDAGRLLTVCAADVFAVADDGSESLCATLLGTARNIDASRGA
ncbi:MAG: PaaI family thioesterase [Ramlibacter sp.]